MLDKVVSLGDVVVIFKRIALLVVEDILLGRFVEPELGEVVVLLNSGMLLDKLAH